MDIDEFYVSTNNQFNRKQRTWFFGLSLFNFYAPFQLVQVVFTGPAPKFNCTVDNGTYITSCTGADTELQCSSITYDPDFPQSFVTTWSSSPCNIQIAQIVQMAFMLGVMVGALTLGPVADSVGRKLVLIASVMGIVTFGVASSFVPSAILFVAFRFLVGACSAGSMISSFVLSSELVGPKVRGTCGNFFQVTFAIGILAYSAMAYYIHDNWRMLTLGASLIGIPLIVIAVLVPESPRWLYANGKPSKGNRNLKKLTGLDADHAEIMSPSQRLGEKLTMITMFKAKFFLVVIQIFSWFTNSIVYYALTLSAQSFGGSIYVATALSGLVELPAYLFTAFIIEKVGRRIPLVCYMVVAGLACVSLVITNGNMYVGLVGKMCIAASFSIIYIHSGELFPTSVRNSGLGLCSSFARIGGVVASFFVGGTNNMWQIVSLGVLAIVAGLLNLLLPETLNKKLPETLDDLDKNATDYTRLIGDDEQVEEDEDEVVFNRKG